MAVLLRNNAISKLAGSIDSSQTIISVTEGDGDRFPSPGGGDWFPLTIESISGGSVTREIVKCTSRDGATLTVERAQEGTTAEEFLSGDRVELRYTAAVHDALKSLIGENTTAIGELAAVTATAFMKADGSQPAWTAPASSTLETASAIALVVGSTIVQIDAGTSVTLPTLSNGTDYTIYAFADGTLEAVDADDPAPAESRMVGGFHVFLTGEIAEKSLWDLRWLPDCPNPRGMTMTPAYEWGDIYMMDVDYGIFGYSRPNVTIADENDRPIIPDYYGGDGVARYGSMSWWVAVDLAAAAGKRLFTYPGFTAAAYGVVERQAVGTDPVTTQHQAGHRSACGLEQATGVMHQWGQDIAATAGSSWQNIAEGRGDVYASSLKAVLLGAYWSRGSNAGSRASTWSSAPDNSNGTLGSRAACGHLNLS